MVEQKKEDMVPNRGMNIVEGGWKFDSGEVIPIDSVKSWNYFENYDHKIESVGHIESNNPNLAYMMVHVVHIQVEDIRVNEARVKYGFILGLKKLLLLKSISQFTKRKQTNKQTNKQIKKKKKKKKTSLC